MFLFSLGGTHSKILYRMAHKGNRVYEPKTAPMMQIVHELTQLSWFTLTGPSRCTKTPQAQNLWKSSETCLSLFCFQFQNQSPKAFFFNCYRDMSVSFSSLKKVLFSVVFFSLSLYVFLFVLFWFWSNGLLLQNLYWNQRATGLWRSTNFVRSIAVKAGPKRIFWSLK